jgi:type IV pilus assembly protein PilV
MLKPNQAGVTLIEVLVTIVILAFGLLGLAGFQLKAQSAEMESYQRAQAIVLLQDMVERVKAAAANAAAPADPATVADTYVTTSPLGTGDNQPSSCAGLAAGAPLDQCEWSNALKGAAETAGGSNVGAMIGAVGCIEQVQVENPASGICTPGIYRVTVAWQGLPPTVAPALTCGQGRFGANDAQRRVVSAQVTLGLPYCL